MTEAEQGAEDSAPDSASAPDLTALEALNAGAEAWNHWREAHPEDTPDLSDTDLAERDLRGADLRGVSLRGADLREADLSDTKGLSVPQLAGAILARATLPKGLSTENGQDHFNLTNVEEASRNARKLFLSMLLVCAYTLLTAATTTDAALVTNSGTSPLPIVGSRIAIVRFYLVTPVLLLGFYVYFHLYAQRLWESLALLPAVLPDGRRLDKAVYPWLLNGLVTAHRKRLTEDLPPFFRLQYWASLFAAWGIVPATILVLWGVYLKRQEAAGSLSLALVLVVCAGLGLGFYQIARSTLQGGLLKIPAPGALDLRETLWEFAGWAALTFFGLFVFYASYEAARGSVLGISLNANFERQDVSIKPAGWEWEDLRLVQGARLDGRNLRNAKAQGAFLAKANLQAADLTGADLREADLRGANLTGATLDFADLRGAKCRTENTPRRQPCLRNRSAGCSGTNERNCLKRWQRHCPRTGTRRCGRIFHFLLTGHSRWAASVKRTNSARATRKGTVSRSPSRSR